MKYAGLSLMAAMLIAGCSPQVPDSGAGVGFEDYGRYQADREARNRVLSQGGNQTVRAPETVEIEQIAGPSQVITPAASAPAPQQAAANNTAISDEQDFDAVSSRESIESDAERLRARREAYTQIQPTAVPTRSGGSGPNIVDYALSTNHAPGQKFYSRSSLRRGNNCGKYASSDLAQEAFLKAGGPQKDKLKLDPDGDGFACGWDPRPFRRAARG